MNEQEILALQNKAKELEAEVQAKNEALTKAENDKNSTVEELKTLRTAKQEVEAKLTLAESKLKDNTTPQSNVVETVNKVLADKEVERLAGMRVALEQKFKESHSEFHPDNDAGGIKYAAFQAQLKKLNLNNLATEEEITSAYDDALVLLNRGTSQSQSNFNPYAATNRNSSGDPKGVTNNKLANNELKLIAQLGWTEERYLKTKKSQPHFVETMLSHVK